MHKYKIYALILFSVSKVIEICQDDPLPFAGKSPSGQMPPVLQLR